jgi:regulator of protease activity HflC (stomatin/prohibitin superfamily)
VTRFLELLAGLRERLGDLLSEFLVDLARDNAYLVLLAIAAFIRAMGVVVDSGQTGLRFTLGRAGKLLEPGFHPLVPFVQRARVLPTRARTLDLPSQRVVTLDGLVYEVDVNVVFRITDVVKAWIQIDDLDRGMLQVLGLSVQRVLRVRRREQLGDADELREALEGEMREPLARWGVELERADFTSVRPSARTLRLTQLAHRVEQRREVLGGLEAAHLGTPTALPLLGLEHRIVRRARHAREAEAERRRLLRRRTFARRAVARELPLARMGSRVHQSALTRARRRLLTEFA